MKGFKEKMVTKQEIRIGDCRELIKQIPDKSIDTVITSPPYLVLETTKHQPIIFDGLSNCEHEWNEETIDKEFHPNWCYR